MMNLAERLKTAQARWWLRACESVGERPRLRAKPSIYGAPGRILIGPRFSLSSRPVASHLVAGPEGVLEIGADVSIAYGAAIAAYERVQIGDGTSMGPYVVIMDTNFHDTSGDQSVQHDTRPVAIGRNCRIGTAVTIARGAVIGDDVQILAGSVVSSVLPSGCCAGGARARVMGRAGDPAAQWDGVAAVLPDVVKVACGLEPAPGADEAPGTFEGARARRLAELIEARFGVTLDSAAIATCSRLADLEALVEQARHIRSQ
jgi:acetyltransferase-like isoleucine patch superfamily enzyme